MLNSTGQNIFTHLGSVDTTGHVCRAGMGIATRRISTIAEDLSAGSRKQVYQDGARKASQACRGADLRL